MADQSELAKRMAEALTEAILPSVEASVRSEIEAVHKVVEEAIESLSFNQEIKRAKEAREDDQREGIFVLLKNLDSSEADEALEYVGLKLREEDHDGSLGKFGLSLRPIPQDHLPGIFGLSGALTEESGPWMLNIATAVYGSEHELYVPKDMFDEQALYIVQIFLYALRLKSGANFRATAWADRPWSTISAYEGTVNAGFFPHESDRTAWFLNGHVSLDDLRWVDSNFYRIAMLFLRSEQFRFALEEATQGAFSGNLRIALASIWSGLESLFKIELEVSHRISLYLAVLLEDTTEARRRTYKSVKYLYGLRSRAVHGSPVSEDKLVKAAADSWTLLARSLERAVALGYVPSREQLEDALFGAALESEEIDGGA